MSDTVDTLTHDQGSDIDHSVSELLLRVGSRVREAREKKGIPRRLLSEISGVSPRYLAQLEMGKGNISIGLLHRVAVALECHIDWLLRDETAVVTQAEDVASLFLNADEVTREIVLNALAGQSNATQRAERICLIGLRGAGKSTLGARVAAKLNVPFLELNKEIEERGGMPVSEIMALYGQEGYRRLESDALDSVVGNNDRVVLAVAGGVVAESETFANLLENFHTIWLKASPQDHMDRVRAQGDERPMAGNPEAMQQLKLILQSREASYARAQAQLDTSDTAEDISLSQLLDIISERKFIT